MNKSQQLVSITESLTTISEASNTKFKAKEYIDTVFENTRRYYLHIGECLEAVIVDQLKVPESALSKLLLTESQYLNIMKRLSSAGLRNYNKKEILDYFNSKSKLSERLELTFDNMERSKFMDLAGKLVDAYHGDKAPEIVENAFAKFSPSYDQYGYINKKYKELLKG